MSLLNEIINDMMLNKKAVKAILKDVIYEDPNIPMPTKAQEKRWKRGVKFGTLMGYIEKARKENYLVKGKI